MKLSKIAIKKLRLNSHTQRTESNNFRYNSNASKSVTHLRNFESKIQSQTHTINCSRQISIPTKRNMYGLGIGMPSLTVLKQMDKETTYSKEYKKRSEVSTRKSLCRSKRTKSYYTDRRQGAAGSDYEGTARGGWHQRNDQVRSCLWGKRQKSWRPPVQHPASRAQARNLNSPSPYKLKGMNIKPPTTRKDMQVYPAHGLCTIFSFCIFFFLRVS